MELTSFSKAKISENALTISEDATFDEWTEIGSTLTKIESGIQWWIGDWINFGERKYGQKYAQAVEKTQYDKNTLMNISAVARRIEMPRRRGKLNFSVHAEVAYLEPEDQETILDTAEEQGFNQVQTRQAVRQLKQRQAGVPAPNYRYELKVYNAEDERVVYANEWTDGGVMLTDLRVAKLL